MDWSHIIWYKFPASITKAMLLPKLDPSRMEV